MKPNCYGTLFPDVYNLHYNQPQKGKAFSLFVESFGLGGHNRYMKVDQDEWLSCQECPAYRDCYELCMTKLLLSSALAKV